MSLLSNKGLNGLDGGGGGLAINGIEQTYTVNTGETITAGDFVSIINGKASRLGQEFRSKLKKVLGVEVGGPALVVLDSERIFMAYNNKDVEDTYALIIKVSNDTITIGSSYLISLYSSSSYRNQAVLQDTDKVTVAFLSSTNIKGVCVTISDLVITVGTDITIKSLGVVSSMLGISQLTPTTSFVCYRSSTNNLEGQVITISGTTITTGTEYTLSTAVGSITEGIDAVELSDTEVLVVYPNTSKYATGQIVTVSGGTVLTPNTEYAINTTYGTGAGRYKLIKDTATKVIANVATTTPRSGLRVLTISGTTITVGAERIVTHDGWFALYDSQTLYGIDIDGGEFTKMIISGTSIGTPVYEDIGGGFGSSSRIIKTQNEILVFQMLSADLFGAYIFDPLRFLIKGVAKTGGASGETITIIEEE